MHTDHPAATMAGRRHLIALLFYLGLALLLTWPLAAHFTSRVTGDGIDDPSLAWNLWWIQERLVSQLNVDIFHVGWMFHPIDINLAFYTLTPLNGLLSVPVQSALSLVIANNLLLLSSFVLGAYGAYLLALDQLHLWRKDLWPASQEPGAARQRTALHSAALAGGLVYGFASSKFFYASLGQFNIASSQWIPFCVLFLLRMARQTGRDRLRSAAMAGLFLVFQAWAELTYATFLILFIALLFLWQLIVAWQAAGGARVQAAVRLVLGYFVVAALFLVGISPFLAAMVPDLRLEGDFFTSGGGFADIFSADLMGYLAPTRLHPLAGSWAATLPFPNDKGQHIFVGYVTGPISLIGLWALWRTRVTRAWAWLWAAALLLFWSLTLGPALRWAGEATPIPGPFDLVSRLPFFNGNRYPSRYSVMLMLVVAVLAAAGLARMARVLARRWRTAALVAFACFVPLFVLEHISAPLQLNSLSVPSIYGRLAAVPGDFAVLELPTGWRNGARVLGKSDVLIMMQQWYQTEHGHRRLGGNTSRNPEYKFQYFTQAPVLGNLIALMNADRPHIAQVLAAELPRIIEEDQEIAGQVLADLGIRYVTVHVEQSPPQLIDYIEQVLPLELVDEWQGPDWRGAWATIRLYSVHAPDVPPVRVLDMGAPEAALWLGEGWSSLPASDGTRYATRAAPELLLTIPDGGARVQIEWTGPATTLEVTINGTALPAHNDSVIGRAVVHVPPGVARAAVDRVQLRFYGSPVAATAMATAGESGGWPIGGTGALLAANAALVVRSAGEEVGNFAHIVVSGRDVAVHGRGYNLVAIDSDGAVLDSALFDTFSEPAASAAMAAWLDQWPTSTIIAGAVADEASYNLEESAVAALQRVGVAGDLRDKFRWSHAFVGVAGAASATAVEAMSLLTPASVSVGSPVDAAQVYGGIRTVEVTRTEQN